MSDAPLTDDARKHLENLRNSLHEAAYEEDDGGNRKYKHEAVEPYVTPILKASGLEGWKFTVWRFQTSLHWEKLPGAVKLFLIRLLSPAAHNTGVPACALRYKPIPKDG
ncbi:predicted protein [Uncinocarpus reesii 1704]|uniref:Uncharacterized protein n=1 Tax=Uncinocarpus reesii (strain UAMH 1704) TaxID=336963 RepID=C4K0B2_UNCRE|nr:uncharacterized protein UREG_07926 [Uncinocarpus reesii 1704]EEP83061.1 predicted protein [Uncinocarpus reesii 1704]